SVLFIDEIHRMPRVVEEFIYPAMEDFRIDIVLGDGMRARTISMQLKRFTLIGATTRSGMLSGPMRDRFKMHERREFVALEELATTVRVSWASRTTSTTGAAPHERADRCRAAPGLSSARRFLARCYAAARHEGEITEAIARAALDMAEVRRDGL